MPQSKGYLPIGHIDGHIILRATETSRDVASVIVDSAQRLASRGEQIALFGDNQHYLVPDQYQPYGIKEVPKLPAKDVQ